MGVLVLYLRWGGGGQVEVSKFSILFLNVVLMLENSADTDEMQHYAAFHLGLHCLPESPYRVSRVKCGFYTYNHRCFTTVFLQWSQYMIKHAESKKPGHPPNLTRVLAVHIKKSILFLCNV